MTAQITGDQPEPVGQRAPILLRPAQVVLRPAVEEQDRRRIRVPPLTHVQLQPAAAQHGVVAIRSAIAVIASPFGSWTPMVAPHGRERIGHRALFPGPGCVHHVGMCLILAAWRLGGRGLRRARTRVRAAQAGPRGGTGGHGLHRDRCRRGRDREDPARPRNSAVRARRWLRGPSGALDRPGRHRAAVPAVRRGAAPPGEVRRAADRSCRRSRGARAAR